MAFHRVLVVAARRHRRLSFALFGLLAVIGTACTNSGDVAETVTGSNERGAEVYASSCASCHGTELEGTDEGPPQRSIVYEPNHHPDASYESAILNGAPQHHWNFGNMPPVEGLTDEDIAAVIAFIRSEQERLGFDPYPPE